MNTVSPMYEWKDINWHKLERNVYKLQKRIYKASRRGEVKLVRRLQKLLIKSWAAKCLAVRRVTQENQGKKTAGVDGVKSLSPKQRLTLVNKLKLGTKVAPTRRVWIPKPGKEEKRPLGIPTMYDRALQGLIKLVLEPEWEALFEPNSYGFRPGRSCHDAIGAIFISIHNKPKFFLDADISQCFDKINHNKLLEKLNTYPTLRRQIRAWLKAGVMDGLELKPTDRGTPQGGVLSPLLANIALHGMENEIKRLADSFDMKRVDGTQMSKRDKRKSVSIIRYADDFLILHEDINILNRCVEAITLWLNDMGLELKPSKTRIAHTLNHYKREEPGFDFLGFNVKQYKTGKYTCGKSRKGLLGFKTIITPSKKAQKQHYKNLAEIINKYKGQSQATLISKLNPVIRGWCNYYATVVSQKVFEKLKNLMYWKLFKWGIKRHRKKGRKWVKTKYFQNIGGRNWVFATSARDNPMQLIAHSDTQIIRYVKVKGDASPYDGNLVYWSSRMGKHPEMPKRTASLLKKQKGKCNWCKLIFRENDVIETDHIIPTAAGGKDEYKNLQLLHRHCHDEKTKSDLEVINNHQREKRIKELYKWFNKLDWIWKDDILTMV
ncbi:MAG: group II intron reverse transcriptase/maturase [Xenococcaceae cyanobacterium MO_167.B27]|nr:group II intron reverse transcriptase/maturase [Xenococcaceae cyanobacterium MO_167.B27]